MSADFGAELDAALNRHLGAIRAAADAAKGRIDESLAAVPDEAPEDPVFAASPEEDFPPVHGAAVDFDIEEAPLEFDTTLDDDGIPMPEEI